MKRRRNIMRAHDCYLASEKLQKRENRYFAGLIGSVALGVICEVATSDVRAAGVRDALTIGRDITVGGCVGFAALGLRNSTKQSLAKDYVRMVNKEFQGITGALAAEPASPENQRLLKLDRDYTELSGLPPNPTEDLG